MLQQGKDAGRRPNFQCGRERAHVRVADQQVQPAIFPIIRERLVAGVDDRAVELHPLVDVVHDMISALADLKIDLSLCWRNIEIKGQRISLSDAARASENLTS